MGEGARGELPYSFFISPSFPSMMVFPFGLYGSVQCFALIMSRNSGLREAPPTRKPSMSCWEASSLQVPPVTEPTKVGTIPNKG